MPKRKLNDVLRLSKRVGPESSKEVFEFAIVEKLLVGFFAETFN